MLCGACNGGSDAHPSPLAATPTQAPTAPPPSTLPPAPAPPPHPFAIQENARTPTARTPDGCVSLELDRQWHSLQFRRGDPTSCPHFEQRLDLLHEMLMAFDAYGDLPSMTSFSVSREYAAFYERLTLAAASSPAWDSRRGKPKNEKQHDNDVVVELARDPARFFPEVVQLFQGTHLTPELRSVEKVLIAPAKKTPFAEKLKAAGIDENAKLPFDCILIFHLKAL
jgi:hypothetical protein